MPALINITNNVIIQHVNYFIILFIKCGLIKTKIPIQYIYQYRRTNSRFLFVDVIKFELNYFTNMYFLFCHLSLQLCNDCNVFYY